MDEGAKDRERQAIVSDLFPLRRQFIEAAFQAVTLENLAEEKRILAKDNPYVFKSLEELTGYYTEDNAAEQAFLGSLICYRALREEAISRGGVLPTLTEQFVQGYDADREKIVVDENEEELIRGRFGGTQTQTGQQIRRANLGIFRDSEPEFSKIAEEEFREPQWIPEDDFRYKGIINLYLLFREGCKNPKNFQVSPIQTP